VSLDTLTSIGRIPVGTPTNVPDGLAISKEGLLYVGSRGAPDVNGVRPELTIERWSPTGDFLGTFIHTGVIGTDYGFDLALDFDAKGNLYVLNTISGELRKYSAKGMDLGVIASGFGIGDIVVVRGGPTTSRECKNGGWKTFLSPRTFHNQGDCVRFVNTDGELSIPKGLRFPHDDHNSGDPHRGRPSPWHFGGGKYHFRDR
jgi:hypothetical protein